MNTEQVFSVQVRDDGIAIISFEVPGEAQNTLKAVFVDQANLMLDQLEQNTNLKGVILISGKPDSFIAGADIKMLQACKNAQEAIELSRTGQHFFGRLEDFKVPVVAAIHGPCLGGGLELAMACHARICSTSDKTKLGLPEVMLGLLPGGGGTQRLPRLVGIAAALDLMLTGRQIKPTKARSLGLVNEVVAETILLPAALKRVKKLAKQRSRKRKRSFVQWGLEGNPLGRKLLFQQARKQVLAKTKGNYPAPLRIIDCVQAGAGGLKKGLEVESRYFGELTATPQAQQLMNIYFATTAMKKDNGVADEQIQARSIHRIGVLGAGLMGAGISYVSLAKAEIPVRLKDKEVQGLNRGMKTIHNLVQKRLKRRVLSPFQAGRQMTSVTPSLDYSGFQKVDLVIEAVFEDLDLKQQMIQEVETQCSAHTIFATNTSSIPIATIAEAAQRPQQIIGMHYFSPVEKMPLLEVIATEHTAPEVIATAVDLGRRQGKTVIVVKDGAGFYVNRILAPYLNEASRLLEEGVAIDDIDRALTSFGFPVGPFTLLDEVGIDVVAKVAPFLHIAFGKRLQPSDSTQTMLDDGRYGRKRGKGFYTYKKGKKGLVDESVYSLLGVSGERSMEAQEIVQRCVLAMVNEAARCWQEGVIRSLRDGDSGAVFGIGFPPFLGGPFRYADSLGIATIVQRLEGFQQPERLAPAELLVKMAAEGRSFHSD